VRFPDDTNVKMGEQNKDTWAKILNLVLRNERKKEK
jgi:hypothetical protein